jgi:hypothetical protein
MVVRKEESGSPVANCRVHHPSRVDGGSVDGSLLQSLVTEKSITAVQVKDLEHLVGKRAKSATAIVEQNALII